MPRRSVLSVAEKESLFAWPVEEVTWVRLCTVSPVEIGWIGERRGDVSRLGFAVQLCVLRERGLILPPSVEPPVEMLESLAESLDLPQERLWEKWQEYRSQKITWRKHWQDLLSLMGWEVFGREAIRPTLKALAADALQSGRGLPVAQKLVDTLRQQRIVLPSVDVIERLCAQALTAAQRQVYVQLGGSLDGEKQRKLEKLLTLRDNTHHSWVRWLGQEPKAATPRGMLEHLERLRCVNELEIDLQLGQRLPAHRIRQLARQGAQMPTLDLARFEPKRRLATLVAMVLEAKATLIDQSIELHEQIIGSVFNRARRAQEQQWQQESRAVNQKVRLYAQIGERLLQARAEGGDAFAAIEQVVSWEEFRQSVLEAGALSRPAEFDTLPGIIESYATIRRYAPAWLDALEFKGAPSGHELLSAVEALREMNRRGARKVPDDAPQAFIRKRWRVLVLTPGGIDRRFYELCVLFELKNALRSGDVWVTGSRNFGEFDSYLLPQQAFEERRQNRDLPLHVPIEPHVYLKEQLDSLTQQLRVVQTLAGQGQLPEARIEKSGLKITPITSAVPELAAQLMQSATALLPHVKITDLLLEVESWTGFSRHFTHLGSGQPSTEPPLLLAALLADGLNLGLTKMAQATPELSEARLSRLGAWYIREETYRSALAALVDAQTGEPLSAFWGEGTTSSSDGQRFKTGSHATTSGHINPKYGSEPGRLFYTHISDQYAPFHTRVINTNVRDATYVLDGLLQHESALRIEEHYTDTAGFTDHVFALMPLLGFKFAPRIRDLADKKLYLPDRSSYGILDPLCAVPLNLPLIQSHWTPILRLATSIALGKTSASLLLRKLGSYPRQNGLALALRELGRLERSLFMLQWLQDTDLRRRVQVGLNKGEARNALARAVFFHRQGELRDRSFENQSHRASGLNLLCAAIILWNTVYLTRTLKALGSHPNPDITRSASDPQLMAHLSPLGWEHINLTGDYSWNTTKTPKPGHFRPLRVSATR